MSSGVHYPKPHGLIGTRHRQICIMFFGLVICYFQRVNLSVGLVAMSDPTVNTNFPTINYPTYEKGLLSGAFYWGYLVSGVPAGYLADRYGPVRLLAIVGGLYCGVASILVPVGAIYLGFESVYALRVLQGLGQGIFYPGTQSFLSKWAIPQEREMFAWVWSGCQLGTIIMMPAGGLIAESPGGWPLIFISTGILSIIWGLFCWRFGADSPAQHNTISDSEKNYIELNFKESSNKGKNMKIPYKHVVTSIPIWAILISTAAENWGFSILLNLTPTYLQGVYFFNVEEDGLLSALPYLAMFLAVYLASWIGTHLRRHTSVNFTRKFWNTVSVGGAGVAVLPLAFFHAGPIGAVILLTLASGLDGAHYLGYLSNHLDLAPNYAGFLLGITNGFGSIASIVSPTWTGYVIKDEHSMEQWQKVFLVTAVIKITGSLIFLIFGSTSIQKWNDLEKLENNTDKERDPPFESIKYNNSEELPI